jgi:hypothetical protein
MLLLSPESLADRRRVAGGALRPLYDSLADDLAVMLGREPYVPREKALLSRWGGRCDADGAELEFDPFSPHAHRCPACQRVHTGEWHDRWWLYPYHLWLIERAVHAATLHALGADARYGALARDILDAYARQYLAYPNRDNVLGPSRLFFSTYLESLWLLHVCIATDLLAAAGDLRIRDTVRGAIAEPAADLIGEYHEGTSNRQVWNAAAIVAARRLLGDGADTERVATALGDVEWLVAHAVGADGSWFEGDNYHQFAHRGLWYVIALGERLGYAFQDSTIARFHAGFAAPFRTVLPDFTYPARKDSRHAASLRQWRFAESCELGLARTDDPLLRWALGRLYADNIPRGDTARARASGEAERPVPAVALARRDLGWKSLLFARETLPDLVGTAPGSVTIASQGYTIHRREDGKVYVALDWGESGGGHGHPDRLNLIFMHDRARWLDDFGTGSYVDPSLHWYRSTLAHNAPLVDGSSQMRTDGQLAAEGSDGTFDVVIGRAGIAPGIRTTRTVVTADTYFVDEVRWTALRPVRFELPIHFDAMPGDLVFSPARLAGAGGPEDGFEFVHDTTVARVAARTPVRLAAERDGRTATATIWASDDMEWFVAVAPGPPATGDRPFHLLRTRGTSGVIRAVWRWRETGAEEFAADEVAVTTARGVDRHTMTDRGCVVHRADGQTLDVAVPDVEFPDGERGAGSARGDAGPLAHTVPAAAGADAPQWREIRRQAQPAPLFPDFTDVAAPEWAMFALGEPHYRRTEEPWKRAGEPRARVTVGADPDGIIVHVAVETPNPVFVPAGAVNPYDNEPADVNGHGVQLYYATPSGAGAWMVVPDEGRTTARVRPVPGWGSAAAPHAEWRRVDGGFEIGMRIPADARTDHFALDVIVNDASPERVRRRGQLVMSGAAGEFAYLRGDRHDPARLLSFAIV